jgi:hypothetical protein
MKGTIMQGSSHTLLARPGAGWSGPRARTTRKAGTSRAARDAAAGAASDPDRAPAGLPPGTPRQIQLTPIAADIDFGPRFRPDTDFGSDLAPLVGCTTR